MQIKGYIMKYKNIAFYNRYKSNIYKFKIFKIIDLH